MSKIGDFQADVGKLGADYNLIMAYIFGGLFILIGAILIITSLTRKVDDTSTDPDEDTYDSSDRMAGIIVGIVMIVISIITIFLARWWERKTETNRTAAQIGGVATEISLAKSIFR